MGKGKGKIEIDLVPVMATLEGLAEDVKRLAEMGVNVEHHALKVPFDFPVDFMKAAEAAVGYAESLPPEHPNRSVISVGNIRAKIKREKAQGRKSDER